MSDFWDTAGTSWLLNKIYMKYKEGSDRLDAYGRDPRRYHYCKDVQEAKKLGKRIFRWLSVFYAFVVFCFISTFIITLMYENTTAMIIVMLAHPLFDWFAGRYLAKLDIETWHTFVVDHLDAASPDSIDA